MQTCKQFGWPPAALGFGAAFFCFFSEASEGSDCQGIQKSKSLIARNVLRPTSPEEKLSVCVCVCVSTHACCIQYAHIYLYKYIIYVYVSVYLYVSIYMRTSLASDVQMWIIECFHKNHRISRINGMCLGGAGALLSLFPHGGSWNPSPGVTSPWAKDQPIQGLTVSEA